jgi:predicted DNA-binding transcriptional regulator YafY
LSKILIALHIVKSHIELPRVTVKRYRRHYMGKGKTKDRTARWYQIQHLLYQNAAGLSVKKLATKCNVSARQIYRDLSDLESKLKIPIWEEKSIRGIDRNYFLPPISFSVPEALNIFLAARLMLRYTNKYDPNVDSLFTKINSVVPSPLREEIQKTIDWMQQLNIDEQQIQNLIVITGAWVSRQRIRIRYKALDRDEAVERTIEPYHIEPAPAGHANYVFAFCHRAKTIRTFRIDRIASIVKTDEHYEIPADFDSNQYLSSSIGIVVSDEIKSVILKFAPDIAQIIEETIYHPSQTIEKQKDGFIIMKIKVAPSWELYSLILGWGDKVEVVGPKELREQITETATKMIEMYCSKS